MARTVEGVFRSQAQAEKALLELKARGLDRDVSLVPSRPGASASDAGAAAWPGPQGQALSAGSAPAPGLEDWFLAPFQMVVTTSARRAPEVAQLLRRYGAEGVDMT